MRTLIIILFVTATSIIMSFHTAQSASVTVPGVTPFWDNDHIKIDESLINCFAEKYCSKYGTGSTALEFIGGYLPLSTVDEFCLTSDESCQTSIDKTKMSKYLGNMYVSGFYGGVWLRDKLRDELSRNPYGVQPDDIKDILKEMMSDAMKVIMSWRTDELFFNGIADLAGSKVDTSLNDKLPPAVVRTANRLSIGTLMMMYGYNYGYYFYLIENPPDGVPPADGPLICNSFMNCSMESIQLETLNDYKKLVQNDLHHPKWWQFWSPTAWRWCIVHGKMIYHRTVTVKSGRKVWSLILKDQDLSEKAYWHLIDLSARFMLVSELSLLPTIKGYTEKDTAAGRCGLLQEAGMIVWLGGYMLGASSEPSDIPEGTFPSLDCSSIP